MITNQQCGASSLACRVMNETFLTLGSFEDTRAFGDPLGFASSLARVVDRTLKGQKRFTRQQAEAAAVSIVQDTFGSLDGFAPYRAAYPLFAQHLIPVIVLILSEHELVTEVRSLASKYPSFRYRGTDRFSSNYNVGGDRAYIGLHGCIIGQALRRIGGQRYVPIDGAAGLTASELGIDLTEHDEYFLDSVQQLQMRHSWSEAVSLTDDMLQNA